MNNSKTADPRRKYQIPANILSDNDLDHDTKLQLLESWQTDINHMLESESEGMSAEDPISAEREAKLANEALLISKAIETLRDKTKE